MFHVEPGYASGLIQLCATCGGNALGTTIVGVQFNEGDSVILGNPIALTVVVPEPTTAALIGLGILGLAIAGRCK